MSTQTAAVLVVAIFAALVAFAFWRFRSRASGDIQGPFGTKVTVHASTDAGVTARGVASTRGGITATDRTGRGVVAEDVQAERDINLLNEQKTNPK
jgi:hypothetical protein